MIQWLTESFAKMRWQMDDVWSQVRALERKTLRTVRGGPFTIDTVGETTVTVVPASTGQPRSISRSIIEAASNARLSADEISPERLRDRLGADNRNLSYVSAILKAVMQD